MLAAARTRRPLTACNSVLLKKRPWVSADAIASVIGVFIGENLLDSFLLVLLGKAQLRLELICNELLGNSSRSAVEVACNFRNQRTAITFGDTVRIVNDTDRCFFHFTNTNCYGRTRSTQSLVCFAQTI